MRYILFFFILIFLMCRAGFSQTLHIIEITDMFSPSQDTIAVGDTVRWINIGGGFHNVVADDNSFTSGDPSTSNWVYDKVFSQPGSNPYYCAIHGAPGGVGMSGVITVEAATFQLTVNMLDGWNLVSIPGLLPANQDVTSWWPGKDPSSSVFKFSAGYQSVTNVVPGTGYWMKNAGAQVYNTGDEWPSAGIQLTNHNPIALNAGWNLFGGYDKTVSTTGLITNPPGLITGQIFKYTNGYQSASTIEPGYAYWINLSSAGSLIIPEPATGPTERVNVLSTENFGRIIITDNAGRSSILYSVNGNTDLNGFNLPPYPPEGMFDIRYSTQRNADILTSTPQLIYMRGVEYPVKIKAEETGIILSDETGKKLTQLKPGEEVTMITPVNKLLVSDNIVPAVYTLEQNYPNPFNPSTDIRFTLPEDVKNVSLVIYDALGQKAAELVNGSLEAGYYKYQWNASNSASGMYIFELRTEKFTSVKKMIFLK